MDQRTWLLLGVLVFLATRVARAAVVKYKPGVDLSLRPEMTRAFPGIEQAHEDVGITRGAVVTSGKDGVHGADSLHALGLAVDLRTTDLPTSLWKPLADAVRYRLNGSAANNRPYQVIIEPNTSAPNATPHIHVEYQPVPGYRG